MNETTFFWFDLINKIGLDNSCWGLDNNLDLQNYCIGKESTPISGQYLWVWQNAECDDLSKSELARLLDDMHAMVTVKNEDGNITGFYFFIRID